jgi:hypothetical protein
MKNLQSTQTRATKEESTKFLKSLINDVSSTNNKQIQSVLVRDRIRTFINPEMIKAKELQK